MIKLVLNQDLHVSGLTADQVRALQTRTRHRDPDGPTEFVDHSSYADGVLTLPRGLLQEVVARHHTDVIDDRRILPKRQALALQPPYVLRDYQEEGVAAIVRATQGVLQAPTGSGKTVIAMGLMARFATPAIMFVHTKVLLDQTVEAVQDVLGVRPGIIGDGRFRPQEITIAMVQSMQRSNLRELAPRFGLVIQDECHHAPADSFRTLLGAFPARYRVGLTATPTRRDGQSQLLYDTVGPCLYSVAPDRLIADRAIVSAEVVTIPTTFSPRPGLAGARLIEMMIQDPERNLLILDTLRDLHRERSLVLTDRVEHAHLLAGALTGNGLPARYLTGEVSRNDRADILARLKAGTLPVMVSTPSLVGEGFNLPTIDTVFLVTPTADMNRTTQILGRVLRPAKGKAAGRIVDFVDEAVPLLRQHATDRATIYRRFKGGDAPQGRTA